MANGTYCNNYQQVCVSGVSAQSHRLPGPAGLCQRGDPGERLRVHGCSVPVVKECTDWLCLLCRSARARCACAPRCRSASASGANQATGRTSVCVTSAALRTDKRRPTAREYESLHGIHVLLTVHVTSRDAHAFVVIPVLTRIGKIFCYLVLA